jgi:hypothetical protein
VVNVESVRGQGGPLDPSLLKQPTISTTYLVTLIAAAS